MTDTVATDEFSIPSVFAKEIGVTAQTVTKWIDHPDSNVKPVQTIGHVKLYRRSDLVELREKLGKSRADYVHPDKYKALEDLHRMAAVQAAQAVAELHDLQEKYNTLMLEYSELADRLDADEDEQERYTNSIITGEALTDAEYDEKYPNLDDSNTLNTSE